MQMQLIQDNNIDLPIWIERSLGPHRGTILYFHGGGMMMGSPQDLPDAIVQRFSEAGYSLIGIGYKLAPETKLEQSYPECRALVNWLAGHYSDLGIQTGRTILFGRSAGACLSLLLAADPQLAIRPDAVLSFYGYSFIAGDWFRKPSDFYLKYPPIPEAVAMSLLADGPITEAPTVRRYPLYVFSRQSGQWLNLVSAAPDAFLAAHALQDQARIDRLPPVYFCHSLYDPDVPYAETQLLSSRVKHGQLHTSQLQRHEIDLDPDEQHQIIDEAIAFLERTF